MTSLDTAIKAAIAIILALAVGTFIYWVFPAGTVARYLAGFRGYSKICVEGVSYLQFTSGASVQFDAVTGQIKRC